MVSAADSKLAGTCRMTLILEVTFQTQCLIPFRQHPLIRGTVRTVAGDATFANGVVFENKWPALLGVAFHAGFIGALELRSTALVSRSRMRIMAIAT
jgi:hypothetical protein